MQHTCMAAACCIALLHAIQLPAFYLDIQYVLAFASTSVHMKRAISVCISDMLLGTHCVAAALEQVVVDLPERRRNRSPQRQAPAPSPSPSPCSPIPAEPGIGPDNCQEQGQPGQRPFSSRPDGGVGWVEPDPPCPSPPAAAGSSPALQTQCLHAAVHCCIVISMLNCEP